MKIDIVRAWKDEIYWRTLSEKERTALPKNPVGVSELTDTELMSVWGGNDQLSRLHFYGTQGIDCYTLNRHVCWQNR